MRKRKGIRFCYGVGAFVMILLTACAKDSDEVPDNTLTPYETEENGQPQPEPTAGETTITPQPDTDTDTKPDNGSTSVATLTPTPVPAWKQHSKAGKTGSEQYTYYNDELRYTSEIVAQNGELLLVDMEGNFDENGHYQSSLSLQVVNPEENTVVSKKIPSSADSYINKAGALEQGRFYVQYGTWQYEVFDENLESVHTIQPEGMVSDPGQISGDGRYVYFCNQSSQVLRAALGGATEVIYENMNWGDPFTHGLYLDDRYLEIQYYDWQDADILTRTAYIDLTTMEVVAEIPGSYHAILSPDGEYALMQQVDPKSGLRLYRVSDHTHICDMELNVWGEAYHYEVDWENGYCLTTSVCQDNRSRSWLEIRALDLYTGRQKWAVTQQQREYDNQRQSGLLTKGIFYHYVSDVDGNYALELWDYLNTTKSNTDEEYTRYGVLSDELLAYRDELEQKYGIILYIGTEVVSSSFDYACEAALDEKKIYQALEALENALALYPAGFLEQLKSHDTKTLGFYLAGTLRGKYDYMLDYAGGFALQNGYEQSLVIDIYEWNLRDTIIHEMSHWIDLYIDECEMFDFGVSYRDEFEALNPEKFQYNYDYAPSSEYTKYVYNSVEQEYDNYYFIDSYAQTNANEDRARCFEYMLREDNEEYLKCPHIYEKMSCMANYIRKYFDTTNWPEQTSWEKVLAEAAPENVESAD